MFLVNYLNRNITDEVTPLFEILYLIEFTILITSILISIPIIDALTRSALHRNIRLRLIVAILQACAAVFARMVVIIHQYFGPTEYLELPYLIVCSLVREAFLSYMTTVILIIAVDRGVATVAWCWYESQAPSTLIFFIFQEFILVSIAWFMSALLIYDFIIDFTIVYYFAFILIVGTIAFFFVYRRNTGEVVILKRGAVVHKYSISRTYQLNENIALLKMLSRMVGPLVASTGPAFVFYPAFRLIPAGIDYDDVRFFCVEMYDLWLAVACVIVISCVPAFEPKISRKFRLLPKALLLKIQPDAIDEIKKVDRKETETYFHMLTRDLTIVRKNSVAADSRF